MTEITGSRWKAFALLVVSLVFVSSVVHTIATSHRDALVSIFILVFFGLGAVVSLWRLVRPQRLLLDDEGLTLLGGGKGLPGKLRWTDVDEFFAWRLPKAGTMVGIRFKPGVRTDTFRSKLNRLVGVDEALPKGWPQSTQEMVDLLNAWRLKAEERSAAATSSAPSGNSAAALEH